MCGIRVFLNRSGYLPARQCNSQADVLQMSSMAARLGVQPTQTARGVGLILNPTLSVCVCVQLHSSLCLHGIPQCAGSPVEECLIVRVGSHGPT